MTAALPDDIEQFMIDGQRLRATVALAERRLPVNWSAAGCSTDSDVEEARSDSRTRQGRQMIRGICRWVGGGIGRRSDVGRQSLTTEATMPDGADPKTIIYTLVPRVVHNAG
jgi:hypothetical protein